MEEVKYILRHKYGPENCRGKAGTFYCSFSLLIQFPGILPVHVIAVLSLSYLQDYATNHFQLDTGGGPAKWGLQCEMRPCLYKFVHASLYLRNHSGIVTGYSETNTGEHLFAYSIQHRQLADSNQECQLLYLKARRLGGISSGVEMMIQPSYVYHIPDMEMQAGGWRVHCHSGDKINMDSEGGGRSNP
ncbi:hypothetical protein C8R43DRAFT_940877 [Mycena crocata]|nr:hypothetical protein C8R43DRAFT_940877 [Mycena crocata]